LTVIDEQRQIVLPDTQISQVAIGARNPSVAFSGAQYGVAWGDGTDSSLGTLHYAQVDREAIVSEVLLIGGGPESEDPTVLFDGTSFCIVWEETLPGAIEELFFVRITP
jgi:hypothetical protein